jgi:adenylate cyclase
MGLSALQELERLEAALEAAGCLSAEPRGDSVRAALAALRESLGAELDMECERKYLLARAPELQSLADKSSVEIEQGWLPGTALRERLRRTRDASGGLHHERALKLGRGVARIEIEEPMDAELFAALWPLTAGCRIIKRRHRVPWGELLWEIDEFLDRDLWLAEVELPSSADRPEPPPWLADCIAREVSDEAAFTNLALAGTGEPRRAGDG